MKFFVYSVFDPEVQSFDTRLNLAPLGPKDMAEQYRRAWVKMEEKDKAFMEGKIAVCLGVFDDEQGKIDQSEVLNIFEFKDLKVESDKGESEEKADA